MLRTTDYVDGECVLLSFPTGRRELTQAEKAKIITQDVLRLQKHGTAPAFITEILSSGGTDTISTFEALQKLARNKTLAREDMYILFSPYNNTEHGKIMSMHLGLPKTCQKHSVRSVFSRLVCEPKFMEASPALFYNKVHKAYRFSMEE